MSTMPTCKLCVSTEQACSDCNQNEEPEMIEHTPSHVESAMHYFQCLAFAWPVKSVIAAFAAFLSTEQALIYWLLGMLIADLSLGLIEAVSRRKFSCRIFGRGILKIPCYCAYILVVGAVDISMAVALHVDLPILELFIAYLIATDAVSVTGHMIRLGLPVPKQLRKIILHAQLKAEKEIDKVCSNGRKGKKNVKDVDEQD